MLGEMDEKALRQLAAPTSPYEHQHLRLQQMQQLASSHYGTKMVELKKPSPQELAYEMAKDKKSKFIKLASNLDVDISVCLRGSYGFYNYLGLAC